MIYFLYTIGKGANYEYHLVKIYTGSKNFIFFPQITVS